MAALMLLMIVALPARVFALDPIRSLTQYFHRVWQIQPGLPQASIYCVLQTQDAYLWLGTQMGLVRFDGVRFAPITEVGGTSIGTPWINDLLEDSQHALWVATEGNGIIRITGDSAKTFSRADGLPSDVVPCLMMSRDGSMWAATSLGLAQWSNNAWRAVGHDDPGAPREPRALCQLPDGRIAVGGDGPSLAIWNGTHFESRALASLAPSTSARAMLSAHDGSLWIGTTEGLLRIKDGVERLFTIADGLADNWVHDVAEGRDQTIWVGTKDGFSRYQEGQFESFRTRDGLSQSTVYSVTEDREGSIWVGTKYGLNQFIDRRIIPFTASEGLPSNDTGPVFEDRRENLWVGTLGSGLSRFDGRRFTSPPGVSDLAASTILSLADDQTGLWIGSDRGLVHLRGALVDQKLTAANGLPSEIIRSLECDENGVLWIGTAAGLVELVDGKIVQPRWADESAKAAVVALGHHRGAIVVATEGGGLHRLIDGVLQPLPQRAVPGREIDAFYEDPAGLLWMGTRGDGLLMFDGKRLASFAIQEGLYDDDIYGIAGDVQDHLWMACSKGIFAVNRADLLKVVARGGRVPTSTTFSPTDGQRTVECQPGVQPAVWRTKDGRLWFSTIHGTLVASPDRMDRKLLPPPVVLEDIIVNGSTARPEQLAKLSAAQTNFEFRYTALSFRIPTRITFRYKLDGYDRDWTEAAARREAYYTNLPPGTYHFHVAAANVDGPWAELAQPLSFTIPPRFYQRSWFWPLCAVLAASAAWTVYRGRVRRIRRALALTLAERSRIARELHDTLMQGFSGVTMEMQALSTRLAPSPERHTLGEIIRDAGVCLREARRSVAGLRSGNVEGLAAAVTRAAKHVTDAKEIHLRLRVNDELPMLEAETQYNLVRIAQEAVSNAVKHSGGRNVDVALEQTREAVCLQIKDDGRGFPADGTNGIAGHYGLIGMRERAAQIGAQLQIETGAGRGTSVRVTLPLSARAQQTGPPRPQVMQTEQS
jgi:signal transduction histidine kinase/sugar lactone lactonase YvrE